MADPVNTRYAVVTGSNKGIGFEICKQLASNGVKVVLTARDEKKGLAALEKFKGTDICDLVVFHQLDVNDPASVASLAQFVKNQFGKLDILVNNSAVIGLKVEQQFLDAITKEANNPTTKAGETLPASTTEEVSATTKAGETLPASTTKEDTAPETGLAHMFIESHELAVQCLQTNYHGVKRMVEQFIPLLELSDSPKIVNVSSSMGKLERLTNEWAKGILSDVENLTEEKIEEIHDVFLKDLQDGLLEAKGWPTAMKAYILSKTSLSAYTRILAKKYTSICINCVDPGSVKTDMTYGIGELSVEEGAKAPVKVALLPQGSPSGCFYDRNGVTSFE